VTETEKALEEIGVLLQSGGGKRAMGGSRYFRFTLAPNLVTYQLRWDSFRRITGAAFQPGFNFAITKNGMTIDGSGNLADSTGTALVAPVDVSAGQVIFAGLSPAAGGVVPILNLNVPVNPGEIVYVSKNASTSVYMTLYFDYA